MIYQQKDIKEIIQSIREDSLEQDQDRVKNNPYYISRPSAPTASVEASKPLEDTSKPEPSQEHKSINEDVQALKNPLQVQQDIIQMRRIQRPDESESLSKFGSISSIENIYKDKPKQEDHISYTNKKEEDYGTFFGHKITKEQHELCEGLKQNLTKGNAIKNMESIRLKSKN